MLDKSFLPSQTLSDFYLYVSFLKISMLILSRLSLAQVFLLLKTWTSFGLRELDFM